MHPDTAKSVVIDGKRYPVADDDPVVNRSQLGVFVRKFIEGDAQYDTDDYLSARIYSNLSGGIGIEDADEGAHTDRFWFGVMDTRNPNMIGLPPLVTQTKPGAASGTCRPLGVIGSQFYAAFTTTAYGWNDSGAAWHTTANALTNAPVNKPVLFDGNVWIPQGANGIRAVTETGAGTGTLTVALATATPEAAALAIWNNTLYAIATDGDLWRLPQGSTTWGTVTNAAGAALRVNTGETPKNLVTYFDRQGAPTLWLITDRAAYMFYEALVEWRQSNIVFPRHPDFGRSACVWRTGEDLWISAAADVVRQTTGNAIVPLASGLSRDQGLPQEYRGAILDLEPEISHLWALVGNTATPTQPYAYAAQVGSAGTGNGQFDDAWALAVDSNGNVWVCDENNARVQVFNSNLTYQSQFGSAGSGNGQFNSPVGPHGIAIDSANSLFVTDRGNHRVQKFTTAGTTATYASQFGSSGSGNGQLSFPVGIAIKTSSGRIYVVDHENERVQYFTSSGAYEGQWGSIGDDGGQFRQPWAIAVNQSTGNVYVTELGGGRSPRVQQFTATGAFVRKWDMDGVPDSIAIHPVTGNVLVGNTTRDSIFEHTSAGQFIRRIGTTGPGNGQFYAATGLGFNAAGAILYAADSDNERVQRFNFSASASPVYATLHAWPGTGWHGLWASDSNSTVPTWLTVSDADAHYRLWWGMDDGYAYSMKLFRGFENPNQARLAGSGEFAAGGGEASRSGFLLTSKFDAGMLGFRKLAQRIDVMPVVDSITATETLTFEFSIDDGGWESLGTVNSTTLAGGRKVSLSFGAAGRSFESIRFRVSGARGSTTSLSPFMRGFTFLFVKIPQPARSLIFTLVFPDSPKGPFAESRTGAVMAQEIDDLADSNRFFSVSYGDYTFTNCLFAGATGYDQIAGFGGQRVVSIVSLPASAVM